MRRYPRNPLPGDPTDPESLRALLERYLLWMATHHYAQGTVLVRRVTLANFLRWCHERSVTQARAVTREMVERYQRHLFAGSAPGRPGPAAGHGAGAPRQGEQGPLRADRPAGAGLARQVLGRGAAAVPGGSQHADDLPDPHRQESAGRPAVGGRASVPAEGRHRQAGRVPSVSCFAIMPTAGLCRLGSALPGFSRCFSMSRRLRTRHNPVLLSFRAIQPQRRREMLERLLKRSAAVARRRAGILGPYLDSFLVAATNSVTPFDDAHSVVGAGQLGTVAEAEASGSRGAE